MWIPGSEAKQVTPRNQPTHIEEKKEKQCQKMPWWCPGKENGDSVGLDLVFVLQFLALRWQERAELFY